MEQTKILAVVQAGGAGGRMDVLTLERAKPALPFAGSYQLLDFPLSNLVGARRRLALGAVPGLGPPGAGAQRSTVGSRPHRRRVAAPDPAAGQRLDGRG